MLGAILFLVACASVIVGGRATIGRQLNAAMRRCDCVCRPIDGVYPWVTQDLRAVLAPGEQLRTHTWFGGPVVCLQADEPAVDARFDALQRAVDDGERARLRSGGE